MAKERYMYGTVLCQKNSDGEKYFINLKTGDKVTDSDKKEAEELIEKTKKAMEGEDAKEITEAKDKLLEKANALATKVYESTAKEGQENTTTEEAPKEDKKDDVVDAEFEEK